MENNVDIEIWSSLPGLTMIPEARPRKVTKYLPEWWKNCPIGEFNKNNIKSCPGILDSLTTGIVIPAWSDTVFYKVSDNEWGWESSCKDTSWGVHLHNQFSDHIPFWASEKFQVVWKAINPWHIKTPPGYSIYQMPMFYQFNNDYTALPGIIDTDIYHKMNIPIAMHSKNDEVYIKMGDPLAIYFPFKRDSFNIIIKERTQYETDLEEKSKLIASSKFSKGYISYRKNNSYDNF